jgi:cell division protein FtsA
MFVRSIWPVALHEHGLVGGPRMHDQLLAGIDVGSSVFCSTVAVRERGGALRYIGHGSTPAAGVRAGVITDPHALTAVFRLALEELQRLLGAPAPDVILSVSGARLTPLERQGSCRLELATPVSNDDVMRALPALDDAHLGGEYPVHRVVRAMQLDGQLSQDPTGRIGKRLEVTTREYLAPLAWLNALREALEAAGGRLHALVPSGVAAAAATLTDEERARGVVLADVGGLTTDVAFYSHDTLRELISIPFGGQHITLDLAQLLDIPEDEAEDLKWRHGAADPFNIATPGIEWGARGIATLQRLAHEGRVPAAAVQAIAGARLRLILEELVSALAATGVNVRLDAPAGVVLTGGSAKLLGSDAIAEETLGVPARCAGVRAAPGFPEIPDPSASASVGLVRYCASRLLDPPAEPIQASRRGRAASSSRTPAAASVAFGHNAFATVSGLSLSRARVSQGWGRWVAHWMREFVPARALEDGRR